MRIGHHNTVVSFKNVSFSYGANAVVKNASFEVHEGDYVGIVGGNGSGKTTVIKLMLGLLRPEAGEVQLFGASPSAGSNASKVGYVSQKAARVDSMFPAAVWEVLMFGTGPEQGMSPEAVLALVALPTSILERRVGELSPGQLQRVMIARALVASPKLLVLDEPTVGVEAKVVEEFYALMKRLNEEQGLTIVLVTHDTHRMSHDAAHIVCVDGDVHYHEDVTAVHQDIHSHGHRHL